MKITSIKKHSFIKINVDEFETTIFKSDKKEIEALIDSLLIIADDLATYIDKDVKDFVEARA